MIISDLQYIESVDGNVEGGGWRNYAKYWKKEMKKAKKGYENKYNHNNGGGYVAAGVAVTAGTANAVGPVSGTLLLGSSESAPGFAKSELLSISASFA